MQPDLITPARASDVAAVAALHHSMLPDSFLSELGTGFLQVMYRRICKDPGSILLVARTDEALVGFIAGTKDTRALYWRFLSFDLVPAAAAALPVLVRRSRWALETLRYGSGGATLAQSLPSAELLSLAVLPSARGRGLGKTLVEALQDEFRRRNVVGARVVVAANNPVAITTYQRCGFVPLADVEVHRGHASKVMLWQ